MLGRILMFMWSFGALLLLGYRAFQAGASGHVRRQETTPLLGKLDATDGRPLSRVGLLVRSSFLVLTQSRSWRIQKMEPPILDSLKVYGVDCEVRRWILCLDPPSPEKRVVWVCRSLVSFIRSAVL